MTAAVLGLSIYRDTALYMSSNKAHVAGQRLDVGARNAGRVVTINGNGCSHVRQMTCSLSIWIASAWLQLVSVQAEYAVGNGMHDFDDRLGRAALGCRKMIRERCRWWSSVLSVGEPIPHGKIRNSQWIN